MDAIILGGTQCIETHARGVLGSALVVRQLDWLLANGAERVIVNRSGPGRPSRSRTPILGALADRVVWLPSAEPLSYAECAARAGSDGPVIVVDNGVLGNFSVREAATLALRSGAHVQLVLSDDPENPQPSVAGGVWIRQRDENERHATSFSVPGWISRLTTEGETQEFVEQVLAGEHPDFLIAGTEVQPGVWKARGALVVEGAELVPPCYLGADSFVAEGASIGPGAVLGKGAVVEPGARVAHARVAEGVVLGQGIELEHATAFSDSIALHSGLELAIDDPLLVDSVSGLVWLSRSAAGLCERVAKLAYANQDDVQVDSIFSCIAGGRANWIGIRAADATPCLLDVSAALTAAGANEAELALARLFYEAKKTARLDAELVLKTALRRLQRLGSAS